MKLLLFIASLLGNHPMEYPKVVKARVTGYYAEPGSAGALGKPVRPGCTAAVSRNCYFLLGSRVYIDQHGVWDIEDLTAEWVGEKFGICTIDLAKPCSAAAMAVGNDTRTVVRLPK